MPLIANGQIFSSDECLRLSQGIQLNSDNQIKLDKTEDNVWFSVVYEFIKKHNPMKLAISSIIDMSIFYLPTNIEHVENIFPWNANKAEVKLNFLINLSEPDGIMIEIAAGTERVYRILDSGACVVWPSFAVSTISNKSENGAAFLCGQVIGKKLT